MTAAAKAEAKEATEDAKEKFNRLTPRQWASVEAAYMAGTMTQQRLAEKFGVSKRAIQRHMTNKKIVAGGKAEEHREAVINEIGKSQIDDAQVLAARIRETKEEHYKMVAGLGKLTWAEVLKAKSDGAPISVAMNNLKALNEAIKNIKMVREEKWAVLGLDKDTFIDEDGLPALVISELTAEQVEALRNRDHTEFDELPEEATPDGNGLDDEIIEE